VVIFSLAGPILALWCVGEDMHITLYCRSYLWIFIATHSTVWSPCIAAGQHSAVRCVHPAVLCHPPHCGCCALLLQQCCAGCSAMGAVLLQQQCCVGHSWGFLLPQGHGTQLAEGCPLPPGSVHRSWSYPCCQAHWVLLRVPHHVSR